MVTTTAVFQSSNRNAEPLDITQPLTEKDIIRYTVPAGGPFVTGAPQSNVLAEAAEVLLSPIAPIAANTLTDPMTIAEVLLFTEVSESELSSGALRRVTLTTSDAAFVDETYDIDYSLFEEQLFESEIYAVGLRTLTFNAPIRDTTRKARIHRVFINANTADTTIKFAPSTWKKFGSADDAEDIEILSGENKTIELTSNKAGDEYVRVLGEGAGATTFVPHIFEVSGVGAGSSGGSPHMFQSFVAEQDGFYLPEPTEYDIYRNQSGTNRVSAHIQLNSSTTGGGVTSNPNELWRQYLQKASRPAGSTTDIAVTNDNGGPNIASVPVQLVAGATYYLYHISNTGQFRNSNTARVKFTKINTDPQLELPTSFVNLGNWHGVNLQNVVTNGMLVGLGTGSAGTGAPSAAFTGSMKVTRIGDWVQQDFLTGNAPGTVVGERFSRQSFNGGTTWSAWFGQ